MLRYDFRGHGGSDVPAGAYSLDRFGRDVVELLDDLGIQKVTFLGLSFGGFVAQWFGVYAPERLERLVLSNTSPYLGPPSNWDQQINATLSVTDMSAIAEFFPATGSRRACSMKPTKSSHRSARTCSRSTPRASPGTYAAIRDADMRRTIQLIPSPTLVIAGAHRSRHHPRAWPAAAETIPGAHFVLLPGQAPLNIELPEAFLAAVFTFLED